MPVTYLNGGSPYAGFTFTTAAALIDQIETTLVAAGWTSLSKVSGTSLFVRGVAATGNADNCWCEFTITGTAPTLTLNIQGWLEEAKTNGSGLFPVIENTGLASFNTGTTNRMWLTADSDAFCLAMWNGNLSLGCGVHFGFCDRLNTTDPWAIYMGYLSVKAYESCRVAKQFKNPSLLWSILGYDFNFFEMPSTTSSSGNGPAQHADFLTISTGDENTPWGAAAFYSENSAYICRSHGRRNGYNNQPILDIYCLIEGLNGHVYPTGELNPDNMQIYDADGIIYRGKIKFAITGVSGEPGMHLFTASDGSIYMSVGKGYGWQGMKIKGAD